jgi:hypothetical protein
MPYYFNLALDNGVKASEISEIITHLAFYSGWGSAMSAVPIAKDVFGTRGVKSNQLPPASGELLPINEAAEAQRATRVQQDVGPVGSTQATCFSMTSRCVPRCASGPELGHCDRTHRLRPSRADTISP